MNWLEAITKIVEALAWPLLIAGIVFVFRVPLTNLLNRVKSVKAAGAEVEMYDAKIEAAANEVAVQVEKLQERDELPEAEQRQATEALNAAAAQLAALLAERRKLTAGLQWTGLTPGREQILRQVVTTIGAERILQLTVAKICDEWPGFIARSGLNGGAIAGLTSVGIVDEQGRLSTVGAMLLHSFARESVMRPTQP